MKTAKKRNAASTAILFTALLLCACGDKETPSQVPVNTQTAETVTETEEIDEILLPDIPDGTDFGGYRFRLYHGDSGYNTSVNEYYSEAETGETMSDAVYRRNRAVENLLNVTICEEKKAGTNVAADFQKAIMAEEDACDLVFIMGYEYPGVMLSGSFAELNSTLHLDFTQPWYDQNYVNDLSIGGKLYGINCDITTQHYNETSVVFYNKKLAAQYDMGDFYESVRMGTWTFDMFHACARTAMQDIDGNGVIDGSDIYGNVGNNGMCYVYYIGAGGHYITEENGTLSIPLGTEKNLLRMQEVIERFSINEYTHNDHAPNGQEKDSGGLFINDQSLFFTYGLGVIHGMRNTETDFGILPIPKQNEEQSRYYNNVCYYGNMHMCIPKTLSDPERTALVTDVLAAESRETLRRAYYEIAVKEKYTRDSESVEMLDLIFDNRVYDIGIQYAVGDLSDQFCQLFTSKSNTVSSLYEKQKKKIQNTADRMLANFNKMAES